MDSTESKAALRDQAKDKRKSLSHLQVMAASKAITEKLKHSSNWENVDSVHTYNPIAAENEIDTEEFQLWLRNNHPSINVYSAEPIKSSDIVTIDAKGNRVESVQQFDVIIVPLIAFDQGKNRLGYGGGAYDRFLANQKYAQKIGLGYELSKVDAIPHEEHDVVLDSIITETGVY